MPNPLRTTTGQNQRTLKPEGPLMSPRMGVAEHVLAENISRFYFVFQAYDSLVKRLALRSVENFLEPRT